MNDTHILLIGLNTLILILLLYSIFFKKERFDTVSMEDIQEQIFGSPDTSTLPIVTKRPVTFKRS